MAVALEVGWGSDELGIARMSTKRAWGDDHQKLLEMMMGKPFDESANADAAGKHTLDLLGSSSSSPSVTFEVEEHSDFLELGQDVPLPSGWEKRLDLKSGTVFFINLSTGKSTYNDPRQAQPCHFSLELLQSELGKQEQLQTVNAKNSQVDRNKTIKASNKTWESEIEADSHRQTSSSTVLDLKLNLSTREPDSELPQSNSPLWLLGSSPSKPCSLTSHRTPYCSSTDAYSSCTISSSSKVSLTCCKRCLMYVMISQADPRCPKCASSVVVDFPMPKKPRFNLEL